MHMSHVTRSHIRNFRSVYEQVQQVIPSQESS